MPRFNKSSPHVLSSPQFGVAVVEGKLFVVGGRDGLKTLNTVESYDPATRCWSSATPMITHRSGEQ